MKAGDIVRLIRPDSQDMQKGLQKDDIGIITKFREFPGYNGYDVEFPTLVSFHVLMWEDQIEVVGRIEP